MQLCLMSRAIERNDWPQKDFFFLRTRTQYYDIILVGVVDGVVVVIVIVIIAKTYCHCCDVQYTTTGD